MIHDFENWTQSDLKGYDDIIIDANTISQIEEILIYALAPAYNSRNKNSARNSANTRLFNTGSVGDIPMELSGLYSVEPPVI